MRGLFLACGAILFAIPTVADEPLPGDLVKAAISQPWGEGYPVLPALSTEMRSLAASEINGSAAIRAAYAKLDPVKHRNTDWFDAVAVLEREKAVWCLQSCLCHASEDVQIRALTSLAKVRDKRAVPFLLVYAQHMAVFEAGSENATIHGIIHHTLATTLSELTGVTVKLQHSQDPEGLQQGIKRWHKWLVEQEEKSP